MHSLPLNQPSSHCFSECTCSNQSLEEDLSPLREEIQNIIINCFIIINLFKKFKKIRVSLQF